ncbi:flocculation protein FLO11-like [Solanum dulcamara]|uniref:flocculation protein FLO11-like n=1 Tax=Solanum dulcamara TaxID=45834 RepID=UPI002485EE70|nr:flocculation protein FLO11-like [Solanum dulcamara]
MFLRSTPYAGAGEIDLSLLNSSRSGPSLRRFEFSWLKVGFPARSTLSSSSSSIFFGKVFPAKLFSLSSSLFFGEGFHRPLAFFVKISLPRFRQLQEDFGDVQDSDQIYSQLSLASCRYYCCRYTAVATTAVDTMITATTAATTTAATTTAATTTASTTIATTTTTTITTTTTKTTTSTTTATTATTATSTSSYYYFY